MALAAPVRAPVVERRKRGRPRDPHADTRILEAAAELLLSRGYDNMTVDDVAARARVGKATVYRRWAKKEDLAVAAMHELHQTRMPVPDTGDLRGDLVVATRAALDFASSPAGAAYLRTAVLESARDPRIALLYRAATRQTEEALRHILEQAVLRGEVRADADLDIAVQLLTGLLVLRAVTGQPSPGPDRAEEMVRLMLRGISL